MHLEVYAVSQKASSDLNLIPPLVKAVFGDAGWGGPREDNTPLPPCASEPEPSTRLLTEPNVLCLQTLQLFENRCFIWSYQRVQQQHPSLRSNSFSKSNQTYLYLISMSGSKYWLYLLLLQLYQNCDKFHSPEIRPLPMAICFRLSLSSLIFLFGKKIMIKHTKFHS